jgi:hypothetical protein
MAASNHLLVNVARLLFLLGLLEQPKPFEADHLPNWPPGCRVYYLSK